MGLAGIRSFVIRIMVDILIHCIIITGSALLPISLFLSMTPKEKAPTIQQEPVIENDAGTNSDEDEYYELFDPTELVET